MLISSKYGIIKPFTNVAVMMLAVISLMQLLLLFLGKEATINGKILSIWVSFPGFLIAAGLVLMLWSESHKK